MHMSTGQLIHSVWPDPSLRILAIYKIKYFLNIEKIEINQTNVLFKMNCFSPTVRNWTEPKRWTEMKMSHDSESREVMSKCQDKFRVVVHVPRSRRVSYEVRVKNLDEYLLKSRSIILRNTRIRKNNFS